MPFWEAVSTDNRPSLEKFTQLKVRMVNSRVDLLVVGGSLSKVVEQSEVNIAS